MLEEVKETFKELGTPNIYKDAVVTADCGFHNDNNMGMLKEKKIEAYVADNRMRKRDLQFQTQSRHNKPIDRHGGKRKYQKKYFRSDDFKLNPKTGKLICPAGKDLYKKSDNFFTTNGFYGSSYMAKITDCRVCELRSKCLRHGHTPARQVSKLIGRDKSDKASFSQWMRNRIDTLKGRYLYSQRMGIAEPPFAHIRNKMGLNRFMMRGRTKNSAQWKMYTMVHNILKIYRYGNMAWSAP